MPTLLITGASGFVGGQVVRAAWRRGARLRLMTHHRPVADQDPGLRSTTDPAPDTDGPRTVRADLAEPSTLRGVCDGVDALIHCAARIGGTERDNENVNARGTAALVAEAHRAGVRRIVHLSTASVYGRGTFRGDPPARLTRNPGSPTSRTRARAEDEVRAAGGVVLRPHLVYGEGDLWVVPGLAGILRALPGAVAGWTSLVSVIAVPDLARALVAAALAPDSTLTAPVYHAVHPSPVTVDTLLRAVSECTGLPRPTGGLTVEQARAVLGAQGGRTSVLDMLTTDHHFDATTLWSDLGEDPGDAFDAGFRRAAPWYREWARQNLRVG